MICNASFFDMPLYQYWCDKLKIPRNYHRKVWEFVYIAQALYERGCLSPGKKGIGFGCGEEPLVDAFASFGCQVLATDLQADENNPWVKTEQNAAGNVEKLFKSISSRENFSRRVTFRYIDMKEIPDDLYDYDFCWSSCALEHLGSLQHGLDFVHNSLKVVKPGGVLVHTTEFNLDSDDETLETPDLSLYRRSDIEKLIARLEQEGHEVSPLDLYQGKCIEDGFADVPPYTSCVHLRLMISKYRCTSIGLIIKKGIVS